MQFGQLSYLTVVQGRYKFQRAPSSGNNIQLTKKLKSFQKISLVKNVASQDFVPLIILMKTILKTY